MEYLSVKEAAEKWGINMRTVQKYCIEGRIEGASKLSGMWMVPLDAKKPVDMRKATVKSIKDENNEIEPKAEAEIEPVKKEENTSGLRVVMPLMNTPYRPGFALRAVNEIEDERMQNIALAEYYYFSGRSERAANIAEKYLMDSDLAVRLSACLIYAYANLALDRIPCAKQAMLHISAAAETVDENTPPRYKTFAVCIYKAAGVLLHLSLPENLKSAKPALSMLPTGIRLFALYIEAHGYYLNKSYQACIAVAETALSLEEEIYPIPSIYLHLVAAMGCINMRETEQAKQHLLDAWKIAQPDDMIEAFGEHHGLLGGILEAVMKKDFKRIINITYSFSAGWRKIHNPRTNHYVADNLTTTEFTVAMLAAKGWSNKEIAIHLNVSTETIKSQVEYIMQKLDVSRRGDILQYMLK